MFEIDKKSVAQKLNALLPLFILKLLRPVDKQSKPFQNQPSPLHMITMNVLSKKEYFTMTELSDEINISKQQMTSVIDKLKGYGFVQRTHDESDRRLIKISLTPEGSNFLSEAAQLSRETIQAKLGVLDQEDLLTLNHAVDDLLRIIGKL